MVKLNKISKQKSVKSKVLPPTEQRFKIEVSSVCSLEISRLQYNELLLSGNAIEYKEKLCNNIGKPGQHQLFVIRIIKSLYNKISVYRTAIGFQFRKLVQFLDPFIEWRYNSCIAILMGKARA